MTLRKILAWCVHFYTALGLVAAAGIAFAIYQGTPDSFRLAFALMFLATLIDATDGMLARKVRVKEVLPGFDGRRLDDLVDFQTYAMLPLLLVWRAGLVPAGQEAWLLVPLLASAYGFCQTAAKTEDGYFLGFPSYWNIMAFYLYLLRPGPAVVVALLLVFAALTFVPARYLYPTHRGLLNRLTNYLGALWALVVVWIVWQLPSADLATTPLEPDLRGIVVGSLLFPLYYLLVSWFITARIVWRSRRLAALRNVARLVEPRLSEEARAE